VFKHRHITPPCNLLQPPWRPPDTKLSDQTIITASFNSLEFTLGTEPATIAKFDIFRKKRNIADYDRAGTMSETEADEMRQLAETLRSEVEAWIRRNHPQYVSFDPASVTRQIDCGPNRVVLNDPGQGSSEVARRRSAGTPLFQARFGQVTVFHDCQYGLQ